MKKVNISAAMSQSFTVTLDDNSYTIGIRATSRGTLCDIAINGEQVFYGQMIIPGQFIIPYKYMEVSGNFVLSTNDDADIDYTEFGSSQFLYFYTGDELDEYRS